MASRLRVAIIALSIMHFGIPIGPAGADTKTRANAKARMEAARKTYQLRWDKWKVAEPGSNDPEGLYRWSRRWLEAQLETIDNKADKLAAYSAHVERMRHLEKFVSEIFKIGGRDVYQADVTATEFYRLEAENWLAQAEGK